MVPLGEVPEVECGVDHPKISGFICWFDILVMWIHSICGILGRLKSIDTMWRTTLGLKGSHPVKIRNSRRMPNSARLQDSYRPMAKGKGKAPSYASEPWTAEADT